MLGAIGDLVDDVVVRVLEPVNVASDTDAVVQRRRGGSAANVVAAACHAGRQARFIGQVGDDATGRWLTDDLREVGADVVVRRGGRTGTIVVLVDRAGERTMLSDRGACTSLSDPDPTWLDGLHTLHLPLYSLVGEPLATTTRTLVGWAHDRGLTVSIDASSASLIDTVGADVVLDWFRDLRPSVVLANELEAARFGNRLTPELIRARCVVVKHGGDPAFVQQVGSDPVEVAAVVLGTVRDTTGAGDAFAAGFLLAMADGAPPVEATRAGHHTAMLALARLSAH